MGCFHSKPADTLDGDKSLAYRSAFPNGAPKPPPAPGAELSSSDDYSDENDDSASESFTSSSDDDLFLEYPDDSKGSALSKNISSRNSSFRRTNKLNVGMLEGTTFLNNYIVVDTLGRGSFGKVKLCLSIEDDSLYAVKVVDKRLIKQVAKSRQMNKRFGQMKAPTSHGNAGQAPSSSGDHLADLRREVEVMRALNHPNLVKLYEVIDDKVSGKILMVVEFCEAGALVSPGQLTPERRMPEAIAQFYFRQMVAGIAYLHENGVIHGDMKPENVLLAGDATVKIADFGQSQFMSGGEDTLRRTLGTPAFLAPEICAGEDYRARPADVWALGVSLYEFIYGELPFKGDSLMELYEDIAEATVPFPSSAAVSIELQDLLLRTLHKDPEARITAAEMLTHPWVRDDDLLTLMPTLFSEEAMMDGGGADVAFAGTAFGGGFLNLAAPSPRPTSPKVAAGGGGPKSIGSDADSELSVSAPASRSASDANSSPSPAPGQPSPADVAAAVFPSLFSMRRKNTSGSSGQGSGKRKGVNFGGPGVDDDDERGAFTLGAQASIIGALQQAHAPNKLGAHPSGKLHLLATDSMVRKSLDNIDEGDEGTSSNYDLDSSSGKQRRSGSGRNKSSMQRQDTGRPGYGPSYSSSSSRSSGRHHHHKREKKAKHEEPKLVSEASAEAHAIAVAAAAARDHDTDTAASSGAGDASGAERHRVELSKPSAFTVMAQQAQKIQAELIAKKSNFSSQGSDASASSSLSGSASSSAAAATGRLGETDRGGAGGKLETIGEEESETHPIDEQFSGLLSAPSDSYEIIDAPVGHSAEPPLLSPVAEEDEAEEGEGGEKSNTHGIKQLSRRETSLFTHTGSSGLTEMTWTTSSGVQQSSQSLTFGYGGNSGSLPIASPFDTMTPTPSTSFLASVTSGAPAGGNSGTPAGNDERKVDGSGTAADAAKAGAATISHTTTPFSVPSAATTTTSPAETDKKAGDGQCEIEEQVENLDAPKNTATASAAAAPSSSPPRNMMQNILQKISFKGINSGEVGEPRQDSEPAPPPPGLPSLTSGGSGPLKSSEDAIPDIQWRSYRPGQKLHFATGHSQSNTVYYIESGMVELRWEATLAVPLTRVLSTMQHPSKKFAAPGASTPSTSRPNSANDAYMNRIDSVALTANKVTTLQPGLGRPGSAGSSGSGPGLDRSETMANTLQQAAERAEALMVNATGGSLDNLLLSHRGASQFVGALSMLDPEFFADRWKASAIAQTDLIVIQMTRRGLDEFLSQNPLAQVHLRASMARGQAEITKLEALERIADAHRRKRYTKQQQAPPKKSSSWKVLDVFGVTVAEATEAALGPLAEVSRLTSIKPAREGDASSAQETAGLDVFALVSKLRNEAQGVANWNDLLDGGNKQEK